MKKLSSLLFLLFLVACSNTGNENSEQDMEEASSDPILSVNNLDDQSTIETYTDIEVSVSSHSEVITRIYINDQEIFETDDQEFTYRLNPYNIPVGTTTIRFVSSSADNTTVEEAFTIDVKHLLFTTEIADDQIDSINTIWDMVHTLEGKLLAVEKMVSGLNKLYSEDIVEGEEIYYSRVYCENNDAQFRRIGTAYTYTLELGAHRNIRDRERTDLPNSNRFTLTVNGLPESEFIAYVEASGTTYATNTFGSGSNGTSWEVTAETGFENNTNKLFYTNQSYLVSVENGGTGRKEDYKYLVIENPQDQANIVVQDQDFNSSFSSFRLDLPPGMTFYSIGRYGFETADDLRLETYNNHRVFSHANAYIEYVDLPILDMFEHYRNYVNYLDPATNYINTFITFGNEVAMNSIAGEITFASEEKSIRISTSALDTDALRIAYGGIVDDNGDDYWDGFNWYYRLDPRKGEQNQVVLSLPQIINDEFDNGFLFERELELEYVDVIDYEKIEDFDDFIFTFILEKRADPLENGYRMKSLSNNADLSNKQLEKGNSEKRVHGSTFE